MKHHALTRIALAASLVACALIAAAPALAAAPDPTPLTVRGVDTAKYPAVTLRLALPAALQDAGEPTFSIRENGEAVKVVSAISPEKSAAEPSYVVLAIDSSGSMKGRPIEDARAAAQRFIAELPQGAEVALVSFSDGAKLVTNFTSDRTAVRDAIAGLNASGETALYDALVTAAGTLRVVPGDRKSIVLLSDGGDTVSRVKFSDAMDIVAKSKAPVYAVALKSGEYNPRALNSLAAGSGGRLVSAAKSAELAVRFEGIARELGSVWSVTYESAKPRTKDLEIDVTAKAGGASASAAIAIASPEYLTGGGSTTELTVPKATDAPWLMVLSVALFFFATVLLVSGLVALVARKPTGLGQLRYYDQVAGESAQVGSATDRMRAQLVGAVDAVASRRGLIEVASAKLEAAGLPLRSAEYMAAHVTLVTVSGALTQLLTRSYLASMIVIVLGAVLPIAMLDSMAGRRRHRFDEQLPDVLTMIASSLRAGWGVSQAIDLVVTEAGAPSSGEFKRVQTEVRLGMPLERALQRMADRMGSADFGAAVTAIAIQREVGGNLAEVLDSVASTVRDRGALRRQVDALTAEGRLSAIILIALPILEGLALAFISPGYLAPLYTTPVGAVVGVMGVLMVFVGAYWLTRVTRIEV